MAFKRVNCAECLSLMAINNDVHGVDQYLQKLERTVPLEMYCTVPRRNLQRDIKEGHNIHKEMPKVVQASYGYREILRMSRSMQSWQQSRNTGRMQIIHSIPSYFNAIGSRARFSEWYSNSPIPWRVISASKIMSQNISTSSAGPDTSSGQPIWSLNWSPHHSNVFRSMC